MKQLAEAAGLDPALSTGHSPRAEFATTAGRVGKPDRAIQTQTRHKSAAMPAEYVREGKLFDDNASEGIGHYATGIRSAVGDAPGGDYTALTDAIDKDVLEGDAGAAGRALPLNGVVRAGVGVEIAGCEGLVEVAL